MAKICLVLCGPSLEDCRRQLKESRDWIDMAELRADLLDPHEWVYLNDFSREAGIPPLVLTLRNTRDGGKFEGTEEERVKFFTAAVSGRWGWFDIEDDAPHAPFETAWKKQGGRIIRSFHDFDGVPAHLADRLAHCAELGDIPKAAVMPQGTADYLDFLEQVMALPRADRVLLAMGGFGFSSRVLSEKLGSLWTYVSPSGYVAAPGQITAEQMVTTYRFRQLGAQTAVFGIIGNPVFHSKSPDIHNSGFTALGLDAVYLPFLTDDLTAFLKIAALFDIRGLSCTIPFKETIITYLDEVSTAVRAIGSCNTLVRRGEGWFGENTDANGFMAPLLESFDEGLQDKTVTVVGTGGAARSVVWALKNAGAKVLVLGRTPEKARALASELGVEWAPLGPVSLPLVQENNDIIVQTTNVGMGEMEGQNPLDWYEFTGRETVYDIIYAPQWTAFLQAAEAEGCPTLFGKDMLQHQAWEQFRLFTGYVYPHDAFSF